MAIKSLLLMCRQVWWRIPRLHFHVGASQPNSQPWQAGCPGAVGTQGCCVHGEALLSGRTTLMHPASPLLLEGSLVANDRHWTIATEQEQQCAPL